MALYLHCKVGFELDSNTIGVPIRKNNRLKHTCFHNQQLWANHPTFSLSFQIMFLSKYDPYKLKNLISNKPINEWQFFT
jgi:hypothetical protein